MSNTHDKCYLIKCEFDDEIIYIGKTHDDLCMALNILSKKSQIEPYLDGLKFFCAKFSDENTAFLIASKIYHKYKPKLQLGLETFFAKNVDETFVEPDWIPYESYLEQVCKRPRNPDQVKEKMVLSCYCQKYSNFAPFEHLYFFVDSVDYYGAYLHMIGSNGKFYNSVIKYWNDNSFWDRVFNYEIYQDNECLSSNLQHIGEHVQVNSHLPQAKFNCDLSYVDVMNGIEFENWCSELLQNLSFSNIVRTKISGDQGVDILAEKDGVKYAIQCKCYSHDLGNTPVQEVNAGKTIYNCHVAAVMTNRYFTAGAKNAAQATGVLLWDRDWIKKKLNSL